MYTLTENNSKPMVTHPYRTKFTLGNTEFDIFCDGTFIDSFLVKKYTEDLKMNQTKLFHNHFYNEIIFVDSGEVLCETETEKELLTPSTLLFIPRNSLHALRFNPDCKYYALGFTYKKISLKDKLFNSYDKFRSVFGENSFSISDKSSIIFKKIINDICDYLKKTRTFSFLIIQTLLQELILQLYEHCAKAIEPSSSDELQIVSDFNFALNQRINNPHDNTKLKDIAKELFISERQLSRIIKKQFGVSFTERKHQLRIESAKQLLRNTNLSIEKISERVAFYDTATFIKQFIKRVGISPDQYRKNSTPPPAIN